MKVTNAIYFTLFSHHPHSSRYHICPFFHRHSPSGTTLTQNFRRWNASLRSEVINYHSHIPQLAIFELGLPYDHKMMPWKFCGDICNGSAVIVLRDKQAGSCPIISSSLSSPPAGTPLVNFLTVNLWFTATCYRTKNSGRILGIWAGQLNQKSNSNVLQTP